MVSPLKGCNSGRYTLLFDIGAHIGLFTLQALCLRAHTSRPLCIVAVEPVPDSAAVFLDNVALQSLPCTVAQSLQHLSQLLSCAVRGAAPAAGPMCQQQEQCGGLPPVTVILCPWALWGGGAKLDPPQIRMMVPNGASCQAAVISSPLPGVHRMPKAESAPPQAGSVLVPAHHPLAFFEACWHGVAAAPPQATLVKVDVEGCEASVVSAFLQCPLAGARRLAVEVHPPSSEAVVGALQQAGAAVTGTGGHEVMYGDGWVVSASLGGGGGGGHAAQSREATGVMGAECIV